MKSVNKKPQYMALTVYEYIYLPKLYNHGAAICLGKTITTLPWSKCVRLEAEIDNGVLLEVIN